MQWMPVDWHADLDAVASPPSSSRGGNGPAPWRAALPALNGSLITLRELRVADAAPLFLALRSDDVARFISPPPCRVETFERFIVWTNQQREQGRLVCFAVVPRGSDSPVGLFQVRGLSADFASAEWGFAVASEYWGTGVFLDAANLVVDFAFTTIGVRRLEARSAVVNGRGNGALRKVGAVREALLRRSIRRHGEYLDQVLWSILAEEWRSLPERSRSCVVH